MSFVHELGHALCYMDHSQTATDVMHKGEQRLLEDDEYKNQILDLELKENDTYTLKQMFDEYYGGV